MEKSKVVEMAKKVVAKQMNKIIVQFLQKYGWTSNGSVDGYETYSKEDAIEIHFNKEEIVLIDGRGPFLRLPMNCYALAGALVYYREITSNFSFDE